MLTSNCHQMTIYGVSLSTTAWVKPVRQMGMRPDRFSTGHKLDNHHVFFWGGTE